uniref:AlNc14C78G5179 protein n=1 Tax=Albugo laibachii Nc14 TaxID=890382 RepID=F0WEY1_9STRA|nr:AlNc14C78G5179 [Albugo laibachii Nc14]|eukprot:CCA19763.1 AlNc14C78G5179 [Albugo laibachii Nc14]
MMNEQLLYDKCLAFGKGEVSAHYSALSQCFKLRTLVLYYVSFFMLDRKVFGLRHNHMLVLCSDLFISEKAACIIYQTRLQIAPNSGLLMFVWNLIYEPCM